MIPLGFRLAAAANIVGVLLFSQAFSSERFISLSPVVFSRFGLVSIMLWGLAYLAVASVYDRVPKLVAVFAVEKGLYVATWLFWMRSRGGELPGLFNVSPLTATFYAIYGPTDLLFGLFFALVALRVFRTRRQIAA
jgi:hypothetical protein